jgi:hypothetical protein
MVLFCSIDTPIEWYASLETVKDHILSMANLLVNQKILNVRSLISRKLNNISDFGILLHGTVATEILLEGFANSFCVQIIGQASYSGNTLSSISLLYSNMHLFFRGAACLVSSVLKRVYSYIVRRIVVTMLNVQKTSGEKA